MYLELGKIVGVWGVKGWIKLHSYCRNRADIGNYTTWWLQTPSSFKNSIGNPESIKVLTCREQGQGIVAQLEGINDRDQAMALSGQVILIKETDLPDLPAGKYYWQQLIGLNVVNAQKNIGKVVSIFETGANDVLIIKGDDKLEVLVPYIDDVVKSVDLEKSEMLIDWDPDY